ncbi:MAG: hypothetical protein A2X49_14540 [Lentisphaerae bacterium GWF2_52_8]|nr:MAG: hypothetical protein A2X49_14540 [Lentisphaerae bacterium GWF2_52_8]
MDTKKVPAQIKRLFTLIELLVVIGIIAILASLLLPSLRSALNRAKDISCLGNEKNMAVALMQYSVDWSGYVPWAMSAAGDGWYDALYSYIGNGNVYLCPLRDRFAHGIVKTYAVPKGKSVWISYGWDYEGFGSDNRGAAPHPKPYYNLKDLKNPSTAGIIGDNWLQCEKLGGDGKCFYPRYGDSGLLVHHNGAGVNIVWCDGHASYASMQDIKANCSPWFLYTGIYKVTPAISPY